MNRNGTESIGQTIALMPVILIIALMLSVYFASTLLLSKTLGVQKQELTSENKRGDLILMQNLHNLINHKKTQDFSLHKEICLSTQIFLDEGRGGEFISFGEYTLAEARYVEGNQIKKIIYVQGEEC